MYDIRDTYIIILTTPLGFELDCFVNPIMLKRGRATAYYGTVTVTTYNYDKKRSISKCMYMNLS